MKARCGWASLTRRTAAHTRGKCTKAYIACLSAQKYENFFPPRPLPSRASMTTCCVRSSRLSLCRAMAPTPPTPSRRPAGRAARRAFRHARRPAAACAHAAPESPTKPAAESMLVTDAAACRPASQHEPLSRFPFARRGTAACCRRCLRLLAHEAPFVINRP